MFFEGTLFGGWFIGNLEGTHHVLFGSLGLRHCTVIFCKVLDVGHNQHVAIGKSRFLSNSQVWPGLKQVWLASCLLVDTEVSFGGHIPPPHSFQHFF